MISDGAPIRAYHCWSLLDNFEWALGYTTVWAAYVDFAGQKRTAKFRALVRSSGRAECGAQGTSKLQTMPPVSTRYAAL
jgi:beta-glucosidase/6-phospho-beta-glucosidase/beta-galactosidase